MKRPKYIIRPTDKAKEESDGNEQNEPIDKSIAAGKKSE